MQTDDTLAIWRKRLLWRACHRGIKEMDILVGGFAKARLEAMGVAELAVFEQLLDLPDQSLLAYATGTEQVPAAIDGPLLRGILSFRPA